MHDFFALLPANKILFMENIISNHYMAGYYYLENCKDCLLMRKIQYTNGFLNPDEFIFYTKIILFQILQEVQILKKFMVGMPLNSSTNDLQQSMDDLLKFIELDKYR